jgi:hypothetical protein
MAIHNTNLTELRSSPNITRLADINDYEHMVTKEDMGNAYRGLVVKLVRHCTFRKKRMTRYRMYRELGREDV